MHRGTSAALVAVLGVTLATARAQDPSAAPADPTAAARAAYAEYQKANDVVYEAETKAWEDKNRDDAEAAEIARLRKSADAAEQRFIAAFAKTRLDQWDLAAALEIASEGFHLDAVNAWADGDDEKARQLYELIATRMPKSKHASEAMAHRLPSLYASLGLVDDGIARLREFSSRLQGKNAAMTLIGVGDLLAAKGSFDDAKKAYADAESALASGPAGPGGTDFAKECLVLRGHVGKPMTLPAWTGWAGTKPSTFKGKVVLLYVIRPVGATYNDVVRALDAVHKKL